MEDTQLIETSALFPRERIPERFDRCLEIHTFIDATIRVVDAKAAGAWGEFECTADVSAWCSVNFLSKVGKKTEALARLSTVAGERGSSDTLRDIRGFALKLKTDEGNWDFVGNDMPVFFIRDPT